MSEPDAGILQHRIAQLEIGLNHWRENAYRADQKCDCYREALERVMETAPPYNEAWHIARRALLNH